MENIGNGNVLLLMTLAVVYHALFRQIYFGNFNDKTTLAHSCFEVLRNIMNKIMALLGRFFY